MLGSESTELLSFAHVTAAVATLGRKRFHGKSPTNHYGVIEHVSKLLYVAIIPPCYDMEVGGVGNGV